MGDFYHGQIQWKSPESIWGADQPFLLFLIEDSFITQETTRGENVLDMGLFSQKVFVDNVKMHEQLGSSDHNQIHFDIKVKPENKNKKHTVETSIPFTRVFNVLLKEGAVPSKWNETNIITLLKKGSINKSEKNRPVCLTPVIYTLEMQI